VLLSLIEYLLDFSAATHNKIYRCQDGLNHELIWFTTDLS